VTDWYEPPLDNGLGDPDPTSGLGPVGPIGVPSDMPPADGVATLGYGATHGGGARSRPWRTRGIVSLACAAVVAGVVGFAIGRPSTPAANARTVAASAGSTTTTTPSSLSPPALARPGPGRFFGGRFKHSQMIGAAGKVASITSTSIVVKPAKSGSNIILTTNASTVYGTAGVKLSRSAVAVGDEVIVGLTKPATSSTSRTAATVDIVLPEVLGKVVSVSGSSLVVQDSEGFWRDVSLSSATVYQKSGKSSTESALKTGSYVLVSGHIAADHQTLDAVGVLQVSSSSQGNSPAPAIGGFLPGSFGPGVGGFPGLGLGGFAKPFLPAGVPGSGSGKTSSSGGTATSAFG
jgi:hypothetical protein